MSKLSSTAILIPARMASTRFPDKPKVEIGGKALLHHTYDRAMEVGAGGVFVVSCDPEIVAYCCSYRIPIRSPKVKVIDYVCGTHRCIAATQQWRIDPANKYKRYINWQVDEPLIDPVWVRQLIEDSNDTSIQTLFGEMDPDNVNDPNTVKVMMLLDSDYMCGWFTREPTNSGYHHIGIYCFPSYYFSPLSQKYKKYESEWADKENLEQMAWIAWNYKVRGTMMVGPVPPSVNVPEDVAKIEEVLYGNATE